MGDVKKVSEQHEKQSQKQVDSAREVSVKKKSAVGKGENIKDRDQNKRKRESSELDRKNAAQT